MEATLTQTGEQFLSPLRKIWDFITKPSDHVKSEDVRRVRLLLTLLFLFSVSATLAMVMSGYLATTPGILYILIGLWASYLLGRTRFYDLAAYVAVAVENISVALIVAQSSGEAQNMFAILTLSVVLATLLLPLRAAIVVMVGNILFILVLPSFMPQYEMTFSLIIVFLTSVLLIVFSVYRDALEKDHRQELEFSLRRSEEANEALGRANALARETVRLKSEFMSTMSHELRTPLNAITGFCGIMLEGMGGEIDDEARHMVERVHSNSDRLLLLINQVLDIAKIEADRIELTQEPLSMQDLATRWQSQMQVLAQKKGLSFNVTVDPSLPEMVHGDRERITQIATNLLSNAFKFTQSGSVDLRLNGGHDTWQIEVHDTGIGIPPHALNYIFDEFRQLDGSSTRVYGGTGLGLAIVRKLCALMNGNVRVTSVLGEGSTFTVTLPLSDATAATEAFEPALAAAQPMEQ